MLVGIIEYNHKIDLILLFVNSDNLFSKTINFFFKTLTSRFDVRMDKRTGGVND